MQNRQLQECRIREKISRCWSLKIQLDPSAYRRMHLLRKELTGICSFTCARGDKSPGRRESRTICRNAALRERRVPATGSASARNVAKVLKGNPAHHDRHADQANITQGRKSNWQGYNPTPPGQDRGPGIGPRGSGEWNRTTDLQRVKLASYHCSTPPRESALAHFHVQQSALGNGDRCVLRRRLRQRRSIQR